MFEKVTEYLKNLFFRDNSDISEKEAEDKILAQKITELPKESERPIFFEKSRILAFSGTFLSAVYTDEVPSKFLMTETYWVVPKDQFSMTFRIDSKNSRSDNSDSPVFSGWTVSASVRFEETQELGVFLQNKENVSESELLSLFESQLTGLLDMSNSRYGDLTDLDESTRKRLRAHFSLLLQNNGFSCIDLSPFVPIVSIDAENSLAVDSANNGSFSASEKAGEASKISNANQTKKTSVNEIPSELLRRFGDSDGISSDRNISELSEAVREAENEIRTQLESVKTSSDWYSLIRGLEQSMELPENNLLRQKTQETERDFMSHRISSEDCSRKIRLLSEQAFEEAKKMSQKNSYWSSVSLRMRLEDEFGSENGIFSKENAGDSSVCLSEESVSRLDKNIKRPQFFFTSYRERDRQLRRFLLKKTVDLTSAFQQKMSEIRDIPKLVSYRRLEKKLLHCRDLVQTLPETMLEIKDLRVSAKILRNYDQANNRAITAVELAWGTFHQLCQFNENQSGWNDAFQEFADSVSFLIQEIESRQDSSAVL